MEITIWACEVHSAYTSKSC